MKINLTEAEDALKEAFPDADLCTIRAEESCYGSGDRKITFAGYVSVEDFHFWTDEFDTIEKVIEDLRIEFTAFEKKHKKSRFIEE